MSTLLTTLYAAQGLSTLWNTVLNNWIGPIFLAAVAVFAIVFVKDRAWMKLIGFVGIAAIVGLLVWGGSTLFGDGGTLVTVASNAANDIN